MPLLKSIVLPGSNNRGLVFSEVPSKMYIAVSVTDLPGSENECNVETEHAVLLTAEQWSDIAEVGPSGYSYNTTQLKVKSADEIKVEAAKSLKEKTKYCLPDIGAHYDAKPGPGCRCGHYSGKSFKAEPMPEPPDGTRTVELEDVASPSKVKPPAAGFVHAEDCASLEGKGTDIHDPKNCDCSELPF